MSPQKWKFIKTVLLLGTVLAALKLIFVDYTLDEEYQIVMAYRNLNGDHLFKQMWEPHQTSAFVCYGLIGLYMAITGTTTGVILFLRFVTLGIQCLLSYGVYRTLIRHLDKQYAFLLALLYFNITPKNIQIPDFGNMQLWFLTIPILLMMKYYYDKQNNNKDSWYLFVLSGIALSCEILTYPTCIILFPFFLVYILKESGQQKWRDSLILTATCGVCAAVWLLVVFSHVSFPEFMSNLDNLLAFDPTHHVSGMTNAKHQNYIDNMILWAVWCAIIGIASAIICGILRLIWSRKRITPDNQSRKLIFATVSIVVAQLVQIYYWAVLRIGYEYLQIHLLLVLLSLLVSLRASGDAKTPFIWGIVGTFVAYLGVMYISDLALYYSLPHGALGIVFTVAVLVLALQNTMQNKAKPWIYLLIISLCLCSMFGKAYTLRGGKSDNTILTVGGIMKDGPAAGILANYMCAYIYNCNYEDYAKYVKEGDNVLIVANMVMSVGTTAYMFDDVNISHFSIVDPTTYDEKLLTYWEQYPDKKPDVIVVDCWYGDLKENPDSWIMQYIENDFGYTSSKDGRYVRFYRR